MLCTERVQYLLILRCLSHDLALDTEEDPGREHGFTEQAGMRVFPAVDG